MPLGTPNSQAFRKTTSKFPTGVTVVTTVHAGKPWGVTASAFAGISAQPPLVLLCFGAGNLTLDRHDRFAVSVLAQHQYDVALLFAERRRRRSVEAFDRVPWWPARASGAPVLSGAVAWFDCSVHDVMATVEHTVILGRVHDLGHVDDQPLLQVDGGYRGLDHALPPPLLPDAGPATLLSVVRHG